MGCQEDPLVRTICELYEKISALETLKPCRDVNTLFTQLVLTCIPPHPVDVDRLCNKVQDIRAKLIRLCGEAEGLLESHFATILGSFGTPLDHLHLFPYYNNYLKLSKLEFNILSQHSPRAPSRIAFIGSGPLPLTSIVLASNHLTATTFHNYDIDPSANFRAQRLVLPDPDLSKRVIFHTTDIMNVTTALKDYEVVFLAALVGMDKEEKVRVIAHLAKHMSPGAILMLRSAHGARAFLYPVVDPSDLIGFEVLSVFHPTDDVINSVVIARKHSNPNVPKVVEPIGCMKVMALVPSKKCCEIQPFIDPLNQYGNIAEELAIEEKA